MYLAVNQRPVIGSPGEPAVVGVVPSEPLGNVPAGSDVITVQFSRINDVKVMHRFQEKRTPAIGGCWWELLGSNQ